MQGSGGVTKGLGKVGIILVLARGREGRLWWVCWFLFWGGGRWTHPQLMMRQGCLHGPFPVGGELLLATHSPRQQMLLYLEDDDMGDGLRQAR